MTVPCKFGCGQQILYLNESFSDGFNYMIPFNFESDEYTGPTVLHACPILEKELDVFYSPEWNWEPDYKEKNRFHTDLAYMLEHLANFYHEWADIEDKHVGERRDLKTLTSSEKNLLFKWKNVIQSDMNYMSYPNIEFILSTPSCEFKEEEHLLILGNIYKKFEMYDDAIKCYSLQNQFYDAISESANPDYLKQQRKIITSLLKNCFDDLKKSNTNPVLSQILEISKNNDSHNVEKNDEEYEHHTQKHISYVEENMRKFIMKLYDGDISSIKKNFPNIWESVESQRKKDEKLLYEPLKEHELDKITFGQLIKILENRNTHKKIQEHGIFNSDDLLRHLVMIGEYRNPLDHSKGLVDGDLARNYKYFVISNCLIVNEFFEKQDLA